MLSSIRVSASATSRFPEHGANWASSGNDHDSSSTPRITVRLHPVPHLFGRVGATICVGLMRGYATCLCAPIWWITDTEADHTVYPAHLLALSFTAGRNFSERKVYPAAEDLLCAASRVIVATASLVPILVPMLNRSESRRVFGPPPTTYPTANATASVVNGFCAVHSLR